MLQLWWIQSSIVYYVIPSLVCWELWKARKIFRYEGCMPSVHAMKSAVLESIYQLSCAHKLPIDVAGFPSTFKQPAVKCWTIVRWKQEGRAPVVLTIDGASRGNPGLSASGGILRFRDGTFIAGFCSFIGLATNSRG